MDLVQSFRSRLSYNFLETEPDFERAWNLREERKQRPVLPFGARGRLGAEMRRYTIPVGMSKSS